MIEKSKISNIRKSLGADLLKLYFNDTLFEEIDKLPIRRRPKNSEPIRCCIYKDRAMSRYRLMALMGFDVEKDDDEFKSLAEFAQIALERGKPDNDRPIAILDMSCAACQQHSYIVTDLCKGCEARPCEANCPKDAIKVINGRSIINYDLCVSCGKCYQVCPYKAIAYSPVPCEIACPVGAIYRDEETGKEVIDYDQCIYCGKCITNCPFGTIIERSQILYVAKQIKEKKDRPLIALIAPSVVGQFPGTMGQIISALKKIGFDYVYEVALGADTTAKHEAEEIVERSKNEDKVLMGTSCCPAYVLAVEKHVKEFKKYVSSARTPMSYTGEKAKNDYPDAITVFIGPCVAKKYEGFHDPYIDYVMTFEELSSFFLAMGIEITELEESKYDSDSATNYAKRFCASSGVGETVKYYVKQLAPELEIKHYVIDGLDKKGIRELRNFAKRGTEYNLIECMSCEGGCIAGPGVNVPPRVSLRKLDQIAKIK